MGEFRRNLKGGMHMSIRGVERDEFAISQAQVQAWLLAYTGLLIIWNVAFIAHPAPSTPPVLLSLLLTIIGALAALFAVAGVDRSPGAFNALVVVVCSATLVPYLVASISYFIIGVLSGGLSDTPKEPNVAVASTLGLARAAALICALVVSYNTVGPMN